MILRLKALKLRTKLLLLIFITGTFCILLFWFLWINIGNAWKIAKNFPPFYLDEDALIAELKEKALNYELPEYEHGENLNKQMGDFFQSADDYTGIYIYGTDDGLYRASVYPKILEELIIGTFINWGTSLTDIYSHPPYDNTFHTMEFKNGFGDVYVRSYRNALFVYPYITFIACLSIGIFFTVVLAYINRRIRDVLCLKQEILLMASGDLSHPVPPCGLDEIGTLSQELNHLRSALAANIEKEAASRSANQDLITAMSHDLRTPLTILKGYLEVLKLNRNDSAMADAYLDRCLKKADDIKEITDKMFEYALVFEEEENIVPEQISVEFLFRCLKENMDFIQLAGFTVPKLSKLPDAAMDGDKTMLKRIFNNLFSNILKYGDKSAPITLSLRYEPFLNTHEDSETMQLAIRISNQIKSEAEDIASNGIGLKSVRKMTELHHGTLRQWKTSDAYFIELCFPVTVITPAKISLHEFTQ